jgi:hypothetical protein
MTLLSATSETENFHEGLDFVDGDFCNNQNGGIAQNTTRSICKSHQSLEQTW